MLNNFLFKLGKQAPRVDSRTLKFSNYSGKLTPAPNSFNLTAKITKLGMMLNDQIGDCTIATVGHMIQQWTAESQSAQVILTDAQIQSIYSLLTGYNPADPSTDNGAVVLDVLNAWRKNGFYNHKIDSYVALDLKRPQQVKDAIYYFGNAYLGMSLPLSCQDQAIWTVTKGDSAAVGSWGGHAIPVVSYDQHFVTCITWGAYKKMTWDFFEKYCEEAYAVLSQDWISTSSKRAPCDIDFAGLQSDLKLVTAA